MYFSFKRPTQKTDIVSTFQVFQLLRYATFFIIGIALAKSGIALKEIGAYETLMFLSGAVSFFWVSGMLTNLLSTYNNYKNNEPVLANVFILLLFVSTAVFILILALDKPTASFLQIPEHENYFKIFAWYILLNNVSYLNEHILLLKQNKKELFIYGVLSFLFTICAVAIPVFVFQSLEKSLQLIVALAVIKIIYSLVLIKRYENFKFNFQLLWPFFLTALPLTGSLLASGSADYIDAFLVSYFFGPEQIAIFRYGAKELPLALILSNSLSTSMVPYLTENKLSALSLENFKSRVTKLLHIVFPLSILLMLFSNWAYPLIFSSDFTQSASIFSVYLLLVICRVAFPQTLLIAAGHHKIILATSLFEITINVLASVFLLHYFGLIGVAYGTVIAFFCEKIILLYHLHVKCKISISDILPVKTYIVYSLLLIACMCLIIYV